MPAFSYTTGLQFEPGAGPEARRADLDAAMGAAAEAAGKAFGTPDYPHKVAEYASAKGAYERYCKLIGVPAYATYDD